MVHNLVHNLCESLVANIGDIADTGKRTPPTPITYLTQWKIVGNSEVHTLPYPDGVVLPNGYKRCKYLQNEGSAYIELPFGFNKTDEVYAKIASTITVGNGRSFIVPSVQNDNNNRFSLGFSGKTIEGETTYLFCISHGSISVTNGFLQPYINVDTDIHEWRYSNYIYSIGNSSINVEDISFGGETTALQLFTSNTRCKMYEYKHKKGNTEYRFIPCLDDNDTPCMYDVINNQAYYNSASSGSFTYELYPQSTEIWSCGEYSEIDNKYHIVVLPQGKSPVDIALTEPLRMVNDVADTIEFPSDTVGKALVTRYFVSYQIKDFECSQRSDTTNCHRLRTLNTLDTINYDSNVLSNTLTVNFINKTLNDANNAREGYYVASYNQYLMFYVPKSVSQSDFETTYGEDEILVELATPTIELIDAPQIEEADSYTCEISQGGKAVSWSSFETN